MVDSDGMTTAKDTTPQELLYIWHDARDRYERIDSQHNCDREQAAYDTLIDYLEANDLNCSKWDPRAPERQEWFGSNPTVVASQRWAG